MPLYFESLGHIVQFTAAFPTTLPGTEILCNFQSIKYIFTFVKPTAKNNFSKSVNN